METRSGCLAVIVHVIRKQKMENPCGFYLFPSLARYTWVEESNGFGQLNSGILEKWQQIES